MDQSTLKLREQYSKLKLTNVHFGGSVSVYPPTFSQDERFLFCCSGNDVKVVSVATGENVRILQAHTNVVTSLAANPKNPFQLYTGSLDGTIRLWDYNDGVLLATLEVNMPVNHISIPLNAESVVFVSTRVFEKGGSKRKSTQVFTRPLKLRGSVKNVATKLPEISALAVGANGEVLVAISKKRLFVVALSGDEKTARKYTFTTELSAVAVNEAAGCVALGHTNGAITLSYCLSASNQENPINTDFHWHAHRVTALAFSPTGGYLISGGLEAVLVIWQIGTRQRNFLPRLGSPISSLCVSPQSTYYAVGHDDTSIRVIQSLNLRVKVTTQGLKLVGLGDTTSSLKSGLVFEPRHNALVLNSTPGCLQFYDPVKDRHITELEVVARNRVSRGDKGRLGSAIIDHVAFTLDGAWMATVDHMEDTESVAAADPSLKFWRFDFSTQNYVLNTRVDSPHKTDAVSALLFHPTKLLAVTAGHDKRFRIWRLSDPVVSKGSHVAVSSWFCQSVGFYREYQSRDAALSPDGSVLAVAYGQMITLWDPLTNQLQRTLCHPPPDSPILHVAFVPKSHFLVATTHKHVYVWNLLTCTVWWVLEMRTSCIAVDPFFARFVVACASVAKKHRKHTEDDAPPPPQEENDKNAESKSEQKGHERSAAAGTEILVFSPSEPVPLFRHQEDNISCLAIAFIPQAHESSSLQLIISNGRTQLIRLDSEGPSQPAKTQEPLEQVPVGRLSSLFKSLATSDDSQKEEVAKSKQSVSNPKVLPAVLDSPAHVIPSIARVYQTFMNELLLPQQSSKHATSQPEAAQQVIQQKDDDDDEDKTSMQIDEPIDRLKPLLQQQPAVVEHDSINTDFSFMKEVFLQNLRDSKAETTAVEPPSEPVTPKTPKRKSVR